MPWFSPFLFRQGPGEALSSLPAFREDMRPIRFTHILNAYFDRQVPRNNEVLRTTFETIRVARICSPQTEVNCSIVTFPDEAHIVPADFKCVPVLSKVVTDLARFQIPRPLPLLFDILSAGVTNEPADAVTNEFIVFTNSDIHLMPHFYLTVGRILNLGHDVITVNRRTVHDPGGKLPDTALLYGDYGSDHPGFDCFIFPRTMLKMFIRTDACVGVPYVMRSLLLNLASYAKSMLMLTSAHLTFHLGNEMNWIHPQFQDYNQFNMIQAENLTRALAERGYGDRLKAFSEATQGMFDSFLQQIPDLIARAKR